MARNRPKAIVRSFSAPKELIDMLDALARYHGLSKSGMIRAAIRKEFWRIFPAGNNDIRPEEGARIVGGSDGGE